MIRSLRRYPNIKQRVVDTITSFLYITQKKPTITQIKDTDPMLL